MDGNTPKNSQNSLYKLYKQRLIDASQLSELQPVAQQFGVAITTAMTGQADPADPDCPVAAQFVPDVRELTVLEQELHDPIGDHEHAPVKGIIHRYPDRVLLTPVYVCPVYCRFCFRREDVGSEPMLSDEELEAALDYIRNDEGIWEVILSGGDPLILSPRRLQNILKKLREIGHVKIIRIHTRVPVVKPGAITAELVTILRAANPVYIVIHTNHAQEFGEAAEDACAALADAGLPLLSQSVLLKGVNNDAKTLESLMRKLVENRIRPYYLHHADQARGTSHFRTTIREGLELTTALRGRLSGLCQPQYVLDIPGGHGKSPLSADWLTETAPGNWEVRDFRGNSHPFVDKDAKNATCAVTGDSDAE